MPQAAQDNVAGISSDMVVFRKLRLSVTPQSLLQTLAWLLFALPMAGCNAPPPQPSSQPTYAPREANRHGERDRHRSREARNDSYNDTSGYTRDGEPQRQRGNHRPHNNTPGDFDFYLLNLSWSPEYCYSHRDSPECAAHSTFVLHGLWPQNNDGTYPSDCSEAPGPADPGRYASLYTSTGLLEHEWHTHGTCSGLTPEAYLAAARQAVQSVEIPPALEHLREANSMSPDGILGLFQASNPGLPAQSLALSCGNNFLTAVEVCLDKNLHPTACQQIRSCRANTVRIPAP